MTLFSVEISAKNYSFLCVVIEFSLTAAIPSLLGMFIYETFISKVTKNEFSN